MTATPTAEFASLVYGPDGVTYDDPAETFHEASSLYPGVAPGRLLSRLELERSQDEKVESALEEVGLCLFRHSTTRLGSCCRMSRQGLTP